MQAEMEREIEPDSGPCLTKNKSDALYDTRCLFVSERGLGWIGFCAIILNACCASLRTASVWRDG